MTRGKWRDDCIDKLMHRIASNEGGFWEAFGDYAIFHNIFSKEIEIKQLIQGEYYTVFSSSNANHIEYMLRQIQQQYQNKEAGMNFKEKLIAIEKSTEENSKAIKELKKELEKPGIDWCVGMWVENICTGEKGFIRNVAHHFGCGELYGCYLVSLQRDIGWVNKDQLKEWTPTPYPYQEFLKVGDRVKREDEDDLVEGTIMEIDGAILILWDGCASRRASKSWYNPHQIAKIGEAK